MQKSAYSELLRNPLWQRKRLEVMQRDGFACVNCKDAVSTLNVHHCYYKWPNKPWEYPDESLLTLCESCHAVETAEASEYKKELVEFLCENGFLAHNFYQLKMLLKRDKSSFFYQILEGRKDG